MNLFNYLMARQGHNTSSRDDLFAYLLGKIPKVVKEVTGVTIHITDAARARLNEFEMTKESSQVTTTGKSLYGGFTYNINTTGIDFTYNKNGSITAVGIATANAYSMTSANATPYLKTLEPGTYTISGGTSNANIQVVKSQGSTLANTDGLFSKSFRISEETDIFVRIGVKNGITINETVNIMLEQGSTATDYEPYTGGEASPSPDYPQEVEVVEGYIKDGNNYVDVTIEDGNGNSNVVPIPLNGNFIGGKDNYLDELIVDKFGKCYLKKVITKIDSYNGETITTKYMSTTGGLDIGATIYYVTPSQLIDLNYTVDLKLFKGVNNISNSEDMMMTLKYY